MMTPLEISQMVQASATGIVDCLLEGTLIAMFAVVAMRVARRQDSGTRFALWFAALIAIATTPLLGTLQASHSSEVASRSTFTLPASWALYLLGAWATVALWGLLRVAVGFWHVHVLRKNCEAMDLRRFDPQLREILERNRTRAVALCVSERVNVPTAIGLWKPAVLIPRWVMEELSDAELTQILLHELAHLQRWDDWTNLAQRVVKALFFFHPGIWWIDRQMSLEREMACDEAVVLETASPRAYAECLTHLAEKTLIQRTVALAQAALGRIRQTSLRVAQLLDVNRSGQKRYSWKVGVPLAASFAVLTAAGVSQMPSVVAFQNNNATQNSGVRADAAPASAGNPQPIAAIATPAARPVKAVLKTRAARAFPKNEQQITARTRSVVDNVVRASSVEDPRTRELVHPASFVSPAVASEAIFVVVEGLDFGAGDTPIYQIRVWRWMVLHPAVEQVQKIPHKET